MSEAAWMPRFSSELEVDLKRTTKSAAEYEPEVLTDTNGKETVIVKREERFVDGASFVKLYRPEKIFGLSREGHNLLLYIWEELRLKVNREGRHLSSQPIDFAQVTMSPGSVSIGKYRMSRSSFYRAREELIERELIAPHLRLECVYWTNPTVYGVGDRARWAEEVVDVFNKKTAKALTDGTMTVEEVNELKKKLPKVNRPGEASKSIKKSEMIDGEVSVSVSKVEGRRKTDVLADRKKPIQTVVEPPQAFSQEAAFEEVEDLIARVSKSAIS